jgi:hypothetical protein
MAMIETFNKILPENSLWRAAPSKVEQNPPGPLFKGEGETPASSQLPL